MSWSSGPHYPLSTSVALLFMCVYGIWCLVAIVRRRSERPGALALVPLIVCMPVVWKTFYWVTAGMALAGAGGASTLAGMAEALSLLFFGSMVSLALAVTATIRGPRDGSIRSSVATVPAVAAAAALTIWFARFVFDGRYDLPLLERVFIGSFVFVMIVMSLLAIGAWRYPPAPLAIAAINFAVCIASWQQVAVYRRIAMTGF